MTAQHSEESRSLRLSRRAALRLLGGAGVTALLAACGGGVTPTTTSATSSSGTTTSNAAANTAASTPQATTSATNAASTTASTAATGAARTTTAASSTAATASGAPPASPVASPGATAVKIVLPDTGAKLPTGNVSLHWMDSGDLKEPFFRALFAAYHEKHPNVTINYEVLPNEDIAKVVPLGVQNGNAPDVFQLASGSSHVSGPEAVREGWVQPLDDYIPDFAAWKQAFPPGTFLPGFTVFDGKTYGFPLYSPKLYSTLLLYNVPYLQQAGIDPQAKPLNWDEFRAAAKKLTQQGAGKYYGIILGGKQTARFSAFVDGLARMAGASNTDGIDWKTGEYIYAADQYVAAIELLLAIKADGSVFPGSLSLNAAQARAQFPHGVAGMFLQGPWNVSGWETDNPDFNFGVASQPVPNSGTPVPLTVGPLGPDHWLYAKSTLGAIVGDLFHYVGTKAGQEALLKLSGGARLVAFPEVNQTAQVGRRARQTLDLFEQQTRLGPDPRVRNPDTAQVYLELKTITPDLGQLVQGLFSGQISNPKQVLQDLQDRSEKELERAIKAAQGKGAKVSRDDWKFPNWDPTKDYEDADYKALK